MKKLLVTVMVVFSLMFGVVENTTAGDCNSAISSWQNKGWLQVQTDGDSAMVFIEILLWKKMGYNQKLGLASCVKKVYRKNNVFFFPLGGSVSDMLGRLKGSSDFKVYE